MFILPVKWENIFGWFRRKCSLFSAPNHLLNGVVDKIMFEFSLLPIPHNEHSYDLNFFIDRDTRFLYFWWHFHTNWLKQIPVSPWIILLQTLLLKTFGERTAAVGTAAHWCSAWTGTLPLHDSYLAGNLPLLDTAVIQIQIIVYYLSRTITLANLILQWCSENEVTKILGTQ